MLGGGVFVTQNKTLPGSYINFVNKSRINSGLGERGVVAVVLPIDVEGSTSKVIELTRADFTTKCKELLGFDATDDSINAIVLREIFCNANKVYVSQMGVIPEDATASDITNTYFDALNALEPYEFNVLCLNSHIEYSPEVYLSIYSEIVKIIAYWRDELGKKCQLVMYDHAEFDDNSGNIIPNSKNYEGVILVSTYSPTAFVDLSPWVAGAVAACPVNSSCTNMRYNGELTNLWYPQTSQELAQYLNAGYFILHNVYGEMRVLEDINSLVEFTTEKGEDFKYNQTIRVIDQIANDISKLFNTKYLGKIPNNKSGRDSLWADIVKHHRELERLQAIEAFDATQLTVEQGDTKKSIIVNDVITVVNAMAQLYMTVVVQ